MELQDNITVISINEYSQKLLKSVANKCAEIGIDKHILALKKYTRGSTATVVWDTEPKQEWVEIFQKDVGKYSQLKFSHARRGGKEYDF